MSKNINSQDQDDALRNFYSSIMSDGRGSQAIKESSDNWMTQPSMSFKSTAEPFDEYLVAMKRSHHDTGPSTEMPSPRARRRQRQPIIKSATSGEQKMKDVQQVATIASMVPDEIIYNRNDYNMRSYETALMFIDVSGFTELCEAYTKSGRGGPSKLTQVLNSYIGAMVQEILTYKGDVLKFSGDAFLSMWKKTSLLSMQDVVHTAIDCGMSIQKNYGTHVCNDVGITLKVKVAISAGMSHFAIIGGQSMSTYVIAGQPVWDVKAAEYMSSAGDVLTSASAWTYVNEAEYFTQPGGDGSHTKVLGVGVEWKRVEQIQFTGNPKTSAVSVEGNRFSLSTYRLNFPQDRKSVVEWQLEDDVPDMYREYSLRPAVINALKSSWWPELRRFMVTPVLRAVENEEPLEYLTEVRHVVIVFLNIIIKTVTADVLIAIVDRAYNHVSRVSTEAGGLVNKVSMFDKDMMFLVVFGMRGLKHEDEAQMALLCAFTLKASLRDPDISSVSVGITSGRTYCGVVGHMLRREYTVIGSSVNKAARLMIAYQSKVSCDKETFVRSKLDLDYFRLLERKQLKGFRDPGPIYEFNKAGWTDHHFSVRHPILGRKEEVRRYHQILQNAIDHYTERYTRYRDHRYGIVLLGPKMVGKRRLLDEFLYVTPDYLRPIMIQLDKPDDVPFTFTRILMRRLYGGGSLIGKRSSVVYVRDTFESKIRNSLSGIRMSTLQMYAMNTIFNLHFPLPEKFEYQGDLLSEQSVKELFREIFNTDRFQTLQVVGVRDGQYIDDQSWRALLYILDAKSIFIIIAINDQDLLSKTARKCIANHIFVRMVLQGIDQWYQAALACQLLDVQAIPADLEKVLESASGGLPGWIQNFVISLIQREDLTVATVPRSVATEAGAVMPCHALLERSHNETDVHRNQGMEKEMEKEDIQMAVLTENYNFDSMTTDMTMDVIILKTYDALTPFEKMLLKCGSVLGDIFPRRMLLHLLESVSPRKVAEAVKRLFEIRVLECEGGDFTRDTSMVLIHPAPAPVETVKRPFCTCLGTVTPSICKDLPSYASCGYMKFRHTLFRSTTYELLTENQKLEMHSKTLMYLERYTRRCRSCGSGCFIRLFGVSSNDGLTYESKELIRVRQQITALSAETRMTSEGMTAAGITSLQFEADEESYIDLSRKYQTGKQEHKVTHVRSFSSLELEYCECLPILLSVYGQAIEHMLATEISVGAGEAAGEHSLQQPHLSCAETARSIHTLLTPINSAEIVPTPCQILKIMLYGFRSYKGTLMRLLESTCSLESSLLVLHNGDCEKLFETYIEYVDLSLQNMNMPQAIRLLMDAEEHFSKPLTENKCSSELCKIGWTKDYRMARILAMRGCCMRISGDYDGAKSNLYQALKLFGCPFPTSKIKLKVNNMKESLRQHMSIHVCRNRNVGKHGGWVGHFYNNVGKAFSRLFILFAEMKEWDKAYLAAKKELRYVRKSNNNFCSLCLAYSHMISVRRQNHQFSKALKLEKLAMEICHCKRGQLDITEVYAVCSLYTSIFLLYVEYGKKVESLEFGLSVIPMMTCLPDMSVSHVLMLWMLKLLLSDLRIHEMVLIMREFFYMTDHYDLSSETWYYCYAIIILLDTGFTVETYGMCEKFYIKKGDAILRSRTPEAAWNFFACMWLVTVRVGAWERSILWEEKIQQILSLKFQKTEFMVKILVRLVEGFLITYVNEINNRNIKKIVALEENVKTMFKYIKDASKQAHMFEPRYLLLLAYFRYTKGQRKKAFKTLNLALYKAKKYEHMDLVIFIEHTKNYWKGTLNPALVDFWVEHVEIDNLLDYRGFEPYKSTIVPYTFPLPRGIHLDTQGRRATEAMPKI